MKINNNKIKELKTLLLLISMTYLSYAQECYIKLSDVTGIDMSEHQSELESKACELRTTFSPDYQSEFRVFDFGFYPLSEYMAGGFQVVMDKMKLNAGAQSNYYLIFGRQLSDSKGNTKIWVDIVLPNTGELECITEDKVNGLKYELELILDEADNPFA